MVYVPLPSLAFYFKKISVENVMDNLNMAQAGGLCFKQCNAPSPTEYAIYFSYFL